MIHGDSQEHRERPVKVLVLIPTLEFGGAEIDLVRNLPRIDRSRFKVVVCAFLARGPLAQPLLDAGIEVIGPIQPQSRARPGWRSIGTRLPAGVKTVARFLRHQARFLRTLAPLRSLSRMAGSARTYLRLGRAVAAYARAAQIDVVHAILPNSYVIGGFATALRRRPGLVMSRVSLNWYHKQYPLVALLERHVFHRTVEVVICNSAAILQDLLAEGIPPAKIRVIPNGIDVQAFSNLGIDRRQARAELGIPQDALALSLVANFYPYKGHADLFHALQMARDRLPPGWVLLVIGRDIDGNLERMRGLSIELGLADHIRFLGERSDVPAILRAADIHVSASHTEGFPNNVLEAMSTGLPVIATAVGGVPEMVIDRQNGLLVPAHDPEAMARALFALAHDPDGRKAMGEAGRRLAVSTFSIERSVVAFEDVYAGIAARLRS